jgi:hypothetical protein
VTLSSLNQPPTAVVKVTPTIPYVGGPVTLDGTLSTDPDHDPITYSWTVTSQPAGSHASPVSPTSVTTVFVPDVPGPYKVTLAVSDPYAIGTPQTVNFAATSAATFAEAQILAACAIVENLSSSQVTNKGNQKGFCTLLRQAVREIQKGHYCPAVERLDKAIVRTDGFSLWNALDTNGEGRDWITDSAAQRAVYADLLAAQTSLAGLPCGVGHNDTEYDAEKDDR